MPELLPKCRHNIVEYALNEWKIKHFRPPSHYENNVVICTKFDTFYFFFQGHVHFLEVCAKTHHTARHSRAHAPAPRPWGHPPVILFLTTLYAVLELAITGGGEFEISRNNFTVSGVSTMSILYCTNAFPVAGTDSKLTINNNVGALYYSSVVSTNALVFFFNAISLTNAAFFFRNNELSVMATQIGIVYIFDQLTVTNSKMYVDGNTVSAKHLWFGSSFSLLAHVAVFQQTTISSSSMVSISDNVFSWYSTASHSMGYVL